MLDLLPTKPTTTTPSGGGDDEGGEGREVDVLLVAAEVAEEMEEEREGAMEVVGWGGRTRTRTEGGLGCAIGDGAVGDGTGSKVIADRGRPGRAAA